MEARRASSSPSFSM